MKLAEALLIRADQKKKILSLRERIGQNALAQGENWGRIKISEITVPTGRGESQALYPHQGHNPDKVRVPFFKEYRCSPR